MKILSVHYGHNATVGLLKDGKVVFCQSEERINHLKNSTGFPALTLDYVYKTFGQDIDLVVLPGVSLVSYAFLKNSGFQSKRYLDYFSNTRPRNLSFLIRYFLYKYFPKFTSWYWLNKVKKYQQKLDNDKKLKKEAYEYFSKAIGVDESKIIFLDHHQAHAYSPCFNLDPNKKTLIFTLDGEGDYFSGSVNIYHQGKLETISTISRFNSLGGLYSEVTGFLGMKPNEDEYKVMGLAPYAKIKSSQVERIYQKFKNLIYLDENLEIKSKIPSGLFGYYLFEQINYERFDNVAAALQSFLEEIVIRWVSGWIKKTDIHEIALSGGVFMNVKLNQKISELDEVKSIFVMPSAGDESLVFGCMFYGYKEYCDKNKLPFSPQPFTDLYLGRNFKDEEIEEFLQNSEDIKKYKIEKLTDVEAVVVDLLAKNQIVALFSGAMEWGARALGNRSILANPSSRESVMIINEMIKNRDFWMPFACSVLEEDFDRYFKNPKKIFAPYMVITFNSTDIAKKELIAGLHAYDFTGRPQCVRKDWNPSYHRLISEFKKRTGIGGVLNTSFNLHGEPLVYGPEEALHTFINSGLKYLVLGKYLIKKPE